jgi:hypothetical protein
MKILKTLAVIACLAAPAAAQTPVAPAAAAPAANVVGTWNATVTTAQGQAIPSQVKLKKEGDKLVGTISSDMGESPLEAEVKGKALTIWFNFQGPSGPMAIEMAGTVDGDTVKGTMAVGGQTGGEWVATRVKDEAAAPASTAPAASTAAPAAPSLTGNWNLSVELPNMTSTPTLVLKQDGEKLTGDYVSTQYGKFPITGTAKAANVTFSFAMNIEGNAINATYTGTIAADGSIKGSVTFGDMMSGTFVATRAR